jgi:YD repeat-containing protein
VRRYSYDGSGRLEAVRHPDGAAERIVYGAGGALLRWEARGQDGALLARRTWTYDGAGRVESVREGVAGREWFDYDGLGRLSAWRHDAGARLDLSYYASGLLQERQWAGRPATRYVYDELRRLRLAGSEAFSYSGDGHLRTWTDVSGGLSGFDTNCGGDLLRADLAGAGVTRFEVNTAGLRTAVERPVAGVERREFDAAGRVLRETSAAGRVERTYDAAGRTVTMIHEAPGRRETWRWTWSAAGDPLSLTRGDGRGVRWEWDARRRLSGVQLSGVAPVAYRWDGAGRLALARAGGHEVSFEYDLAGRLTGQASSNGTAAAFEYDFAGRLAAVRVRRGGAEGFAAEWTYDAEGRLRAPSGAVAVSVASGAAPAVETDWLGRRSAETVNGVRREVWWDGERLLGVGDDLYVTHPQSGAPLFALLGGQAVFYVLNPMGDVAALLDAGGNVARRYSYDAQGRPQEPHDPADPNRLRWRGRFFDPWSGQTWFGARAWDPGTGRFLTPPPAEEVFEGVLERMRAMQDPLRRD